MEKLSAQKKLSIVKLYLSGLSYDQIVAKTRVSKGTVANVVAELKSGAFPEAADAAEQIEVLRELSLDLKHSGLSPGQCAVGLAVVNRVKECGLDAADIDRLPLVLKVATSEDKAREFVELVYRIHQYQEKTGLTLEQADQKLQQLEAKARELGPVLQQLEESRKEFKQLAKRRDDLVPTVDSLDQKYALLNPRVKELEKREGELLRQIRDEQAAIEKAQADLAILSQEKQDMIGKAEAATSELQKEKQKLLKAGFSLEGLTEFNERTRVIAARHHVTTSALRVRLLSELETMDKGLGLEALIKTKEVELKNYEQAIAAAQKEQAALKGSIATLEEQLAALEAGIKTARDKVTMELATIVPAMRDEVTRLANDLRTGNQAVLAEVNRLKEQAIEVGKEIGRYENQVKANEWLLELLSLMRNEDSVKVERVRTILLLVLQSSYSWMKRNELKAGSGAPMPATRSFIEKLEQWQI